MIGARSALSWRDLTRESVAAALARPARAVLTALGTAAGVGTFVATTGLASTAQAQVGARFDALVATEVRITDARPDGTDPLPQDVDGPLLRLRGVEQAGVYWTVPDEQLTIRALAAREHPAPGGLLAMAASPGALAAAHARVANGIAYDGFHEARAERVALLGANAAQRLGISRLDDQPAVFIGDRAFTVVGIIDAVDRVPDLMLSVVVPTRTAERELPSPGGERTVLIEVQPGAAELIGRQAPLALRPDDPTRLQASVPPDPRDLRAAISSDLAGLLFGLAGLALVVGMIGIANTTLVAVLERRAEIGVRRSLGARQRHIAAQFLCESGALGALGGLLGASSGSLVVVGIATSRGWTTVIDPALAFPAPLLGAATGVLAGAYPALRAARIEPTAALRGV